MLSLSDSEKLGRTCCCVRDTAERSPLLESQGRKECAKVMAVGGAARLEMVSEGGFSEEGLEVRGR